MTINHPQVDKPKGAIITSYGVTFSEHVGLVARNLHEPFTVTGFTVVSPPHLEWRLRSRRWSPTQEEYADMGLLKNGTKISDNTFHEASIFVQLFDRFRFSIVKLLYWQQFKRQRERYETEEQLND